MEPGSISLKEALRPAVYLLVYKGKVMYVGQSGTPLSRFYNHLKTKKSLMTPFGPRMAGAIPFDDIWVIPTMTIDLEAKEKELIEKYRPKYNIKHNREPAIPFDMKALVASLIPAKPQGHPCVVGKIERRI